MTNNYTYASTVKVSRKSARARNRSGAVHRYTPKAYNTDNFEFSARRCQMHQKRANLKKTKHPAPRKPTSTNSTRVAKWRKSHRLGSNGNNRASAARRFVFAASEVDYKDLKSILVKLQNHTITEIPRIHNKIDNVILRKLGIKKETYTNYRAQVLNYLDEIKNNDQVLAALAKDFADRDAGRPRQHKKTGPKPNKRK
ncbi:hypothetical protein FC83_GL002316 [Agrilactobacillus composti DSM 18527 = JCM 14202]|uniref:Uncharacterized protein n=1 Tax=Agrilactobacillus composti DSM 18527 = JCM 14202 TaxID=1423734 RepID=A0A0R1XVY4_9LACO|nr:hypothetical protein [Agrilactobacillus composti]KRM33933.1 hypothetical protein FC83_GL002316 [Agrilactobacillus composti DSM 18527 = JCM 14202]